jgi:acetoacetyl-CoA reductase
MARVAVVTGGTRGIGEAISKALKAAGYKVAASYAGNDEAANKFKAETGINVYKWDVSNYDACVAGLKQVEADLGPVEVLVNNAGITKDAPFHRMTPDQWYAVINTNLNSLFNMTRPSGKGCVRASSAASSTSPRSTGRRDSSGRRTIHPRRRATSASPRRWRSKARVPASR